MANYATLKSAIQQVVKTNGNNEITGALLQQSLLAMINSLGQYYQFAGLATPTTNPGTPDQNVFYIASTAGSYSNFGGLVLADGEIAILKYNGTWSKDSSGAASLQYAERKIELLAWIGASSSGHTWAVGEKIYNTTRGTLAVCTIPSPNPDFGPGYYPNKESLYLYNGVLYQWDGNNMTPITDPSVVIALEKEVDKVKLSIYGDGSNTYPVTAGVSIDGTDINSSYVFPIYLSQGEKFTISKTSSVVGNIIIYAIKSDNTRTSLGTLGNVEVEKTAPFDMVGIGVYITGGNISGNGEYTLTIKKTSLAQTQQDVIELKNKSAVWDGNKYQIEQLPENRIFNASLFAIGDLWHGRPDTSVKYRVYMTQRQTAQKNILLSALPGFRFVVDFFENDVWVSASGWRTTYLIPENSVFQIKIGHTSPEDTSITADIQTFVANVIYPTDFYTEFKGNGQLEYYGQKIPSLSLLSKSFKCSEETLVTETKGSSDNYMTSGMVVYNGKAFCFTDNMDGVSYCCVFDLATKAQIYKATLPWVAHNNNAQPTPYFYDPNDTYPLFLVSYGNYSGGEQKFVFVRVVESSGTFTFTVVKEIAYSGFAGEQYNCSWFANYEKNELYCYCYPNGPWSVTSNNPIIFHIFDIVSLDNYDTVTLTGDDIKKTITLQDHWIMQSALYHNDKIFVQVEADGSWQSITINGQPYDFSKGRHFLFVINANSGYIETVVPIHEDQEQEGLSVYDGALYMSEKNTTAAQGNVCFRLVKYTFE